MKQYKFLTAEQLSERLNVSLATAYRLISDANFEALKIRGCLRVSEASVDDYIRRRILLFSVENGIPGIPD